MNRLLTTNQTLFCGARPAFFLKGEKGLDFHLAANVVDSDGSGGNIQQWLKLELRDDVTRWLKEAGRLPSSTITEYF